MSSCTHSRNVHGISVMCQGLLKAVGKRQETRVGLYSHRETHTSQLNKQIISDMEKIRQLERQSAWKGEPTKEGGQQRDTVTS